MVEGLGLVCVLFAEIITALRVDNKIVDKRGGAKSMLSSRIQT
jgi:hypothetical protein